MSQFTPQCACSGLRRVYSTRRKSDRAPVLWLLCCTQRAEEAHLDYSMAERGRWSPFLIVTGILLLSFFVNLRTPRRSSDFPRLFRLYIRAVKGDHQDPYHPPGLKTTQTTVNDPHRKCRKHSSEGVESHSFSFDLWKYGMLTITRIDKLTRLLFNPSLRLGLVTLQTPLDLDLCVSYNVLGSFDTRNVPGFSVAGANWPSGACKASRPSFSSFHA